MYSYLLVLLSLIVLASATEVSTGCQHPQCKWLCDDPECPAKCHPVCARPNCQMDCKPTECAKCEVHCEEPACSVRCPKEMCEMDNCPKCETVCRPAVCRTTCTAPEPNCSPLCEPTKCAWKCRTPTLCPKPKCQLTCEKPDCNDGKVFGLASAQANGGCCACNSQNVAFAMLHADVHARTNNVNAKAEKPSLMELMSNLQAKGESHQSCCPCAGPSN